MTVIYLLFFSPFLMENLLIYRQHFEHKAFKFFCITVTKTSVYVNNFVQKQ